MVLMLGSCKDATKNLMPAVTGKINQVLIIAEKNTWDGPVGDTIREFFGQEQDGLPQAEPIFDVLNLPERYFDKNMKVWVSDDEYRIPVMVEAKIIVGSVKGILDEANSKF